MLFAIEGFVFNTLEIQRFIILFDSVVPFEEILIRLTTSHEIKKERENLFFHFCHSKENCFVVCTSILLSPKML